MAKSTQKRKATTEEGASNDDNNNKKKKRSTRSTTTTNETQRLMHSTSSESDFEGEDEREGDDDSGQEVAAILVAQQRPPPPPAQPSSRLPPPPTTTTTTATTTTTTNEEVMKDSQQESDSQEVVVKPSSLSKKKGNRSQSRTKPPRVRRNPVNQSGEPVVIPPQPSPFIKKKKKPTSNENDKLDSNQKGKEIEAQEPEEDQEEQHERTKNRNARAEDQEEEVDEFGGTKEITSKKHPTLNSNQQYGKRARRKSISNEETRSTKEKEKDKGDEGGENRIEDDNSQEEGGGGGSQADIDEGGERVSKKQRTTGKKVAEKGKGKENQALFSQEEEDEGGDADSEEQQGDEDGDEEGDENATDYDEPPHQGGKKVSSSSSAKTKEKNKNKISTSVTSSGKKGKGKGKRKQVANDSEGDQEEEEEEEEQESNEADSSRSKRRRKRSQTSSQAIVSSDSEFNPPPHKKKKKRQVISKSDGRTVAARKREEEQREKNLKQAQSNYDKPIDSESDSEDEDPDRCNNPKRLKSFTRWSRKKREFVPYKIWLHPITKSWKKDDGSNELIPRDKIVELVEENGGQVVGDQLRDLEDCQIAVVPEFHTKAYKLIYETAYLLEKTLVKTSWILQTLELRDDEEAPGFHENLYHLSHQPPVPRQKDENPSTSDEDEDPLQKIPYKVSEEEEKYWLELAERVEKGKRLTTSEMARKLEKKFRDKYYRSHKDYLKLYPQFLNKMLEQKKSRFPAPRTKNDRKELDAMKLFTSSNESEGDGEREKNVEEGGEQQNQIEDKENRGEGAGDRRSINPFEKKKKSKYMMEMEATEARDKEEQGGEEQSRGQESEQSLAPMPSGFELSSEDDQEAIDLETLSKEYSRPFSKSKIDEALMDCNVEDQDDVEKLVNPDSWYALKATGKHFTDKILFERLKFLKKEGAEKDPRTEEGKRAREELWYPTSLNL